jgi:hypothetical protein
MRQFYRRHNLRKICLDLGGATEDDLKTDSKMSEFIVRKEKSKAGPRLEKPHNRCVPQDKWPVDGERPFSYYLMGDVSA